MNYPKQVQLMKRLDKIFGKFLVKLIPAPCQSLLKFVSNQILIIRPGGIGDAVLTIPLIKTIKKSYPDVKIDVLAEKRNFSIYTVCAEIRNVYLYDRPKQLMAATRNNYDIIIDTEQWHRLSAVIARMCKPPMLVGFNTNERSKLLTHDIPYSHDDYEVNSFLNLLSPLGIDLPQELEYPFIHIPVAQVDSVTNLLRPLSSKEFITLFPGASIVEKRWDDEKFVTLAGKLNRLGFAVVILGAADGRQIGEKIIAKTWGLNLAGKTSLLESAAVIQKSHMLISGDTGLLHIAAGLGVPIVSLFGPSNINKWAPRGTRNINVSRNLSCSPCSKFGNTPKCPIHRKCMADISADQVMVAVERLVGITSKLRLK